jgi:hypothetical protein
MVADLVRVAGTIASVVLEPVRCGPFHHRKPGPINRGAGQAAGVDMISQRLTPVPLWRDRKSSPLSSWIAEPALEFSGPVKVCSGQEPGVCFLLFIIERQF